MAATFLFSPRVVALAMVLSATRLSSGAVLVLAWDMSAEPGSEASAHSEHAPENGPANTSAMTRNAMSGGQTGRVAAGALDLNSDSESNGLNEFVDLGFTITLQMSDELANSMITMPAPPTGAQPPVVFPPFDEIAAPIETVDATPAADPVDSFVDWAPAQFLPPLLFPVPPTEIRDLTTTGTEGEHSSPWELPGSPWVESIYGAPNLPQTDEIGLKGVADTFGVTDYADAPGSFLDNQIHATATPEASTLVVWAVLMGSGFAYRSRSRAWSGFERG
jgi:hypothetical protein